MTREMKPPMLECSEHSRPCDQPTSRPSNHSIVIARRPTFGFTLVELLVVIGVIAVLIGILMPALTKARSASLITKCSATMRQVGVAGQMHAQNHRGFYPLAGMLDGIKDGEPHEVRDIAKQKYSYIYLQHGVNKTVIASWSTSLAQYLTKRRILDGYSNDDYITDEHGDGDFLRFFICPADVTKSDELGDELWIHGFSVSSSNSYGWLLKQSFVVNEGIFGLNDTRGRLRGQISKVSDPARTFMMIDGKAAPLYNVPGFGVTKWLVIANGSKLGTTAQGKTFNSISLSEAFAPSTSPAMASKKENFDIYRHKGKLNILFVDGHVETRNLTAGDLRDVYILPPAK